MSSFKKGTNSISVKNLLNHVFFRISLLPAGIAGKRMFSKKYPIEIRPNAVPPPDTIIKDPAASPETAAARTEDTADAEDKPTAGGENYFSLGMQISS